MKSKYLPLVLLGLLALSFAGKAADAQQQFAIKSVGTMSCRHYLAAHDKGGDEYILFGGYLGGYITAYNQLTPGTFDILPWQNTDTVAGMMANYCHKHPEENFAVAVNRLIAILKPDQLSGATEVIEIGAGAGTLRIYREALRRAQSKLAGLGHYQGKADGLFGPATHAALERFQQAAALPKTGLPDQATLFRLHY